MNAWVCDNCSRVSKDQAPAGWAFVTVWNGTATPDIIVVCSDVCIAAEKTRLGKKPK